MMLNLLTRKNVAEFKCVRIRLVIFQHTYCQVDLTTQIFVKSSGGSKLEEKKLRRLFKEEMLDVLER